MLGAYCPIKLIFFIVDLLHNVCVWELSAPKLEDKSKNASIDS